MNFTIKKYLRDSLYYVDFDFEGFDQNDDRTQGLGVPTVEVRIWDGTYKRVRIIDSYSPYGFYTIEEASKYLDQLRSQLKTIKDRWDTFNDAWSGEEVL